MNYNSSLPQQNVLRMEQNIILSSLVNSSVQSSVKIIMKLIKKSLNFLRTALLIPSKLSSLFLRLNLRECKFCKFTHAVEAVLLKH